MQILRTLTLALAATFTLTTASSAQNIPFTELDRFEARLPKTLAYDPTTCSLWMTWRTHVIANTSLKGTPLATVDAGSGSISAVTAGPNGVFALKTGPSVAKVVDGTLNDFIPLPQPNTRYSSLYGGVVLPDGTLVLSFRDSRTLAAFPPEGETLIALPFDLPGDLRDLAYDPATNTLFGIMRAFRRGMERPVEMLVMFDRNLTVIGYSDLAAFGVGPTGITIQPETGDLFVSFLDLGQINGTILRLKIEDPTLYPPDALRPASTC